MSFVQYLMSNEWKNARGKSRKSRILLIYVAVSPTRIIINFPHRHHHPLIFTFDSFFWWRCIASATAFTEQPGNGQGRHKSICDKINSILNNYYDLPDTLALVTPAPSSASTSSSKRALDIRKLIHFQFRRLWTATVNHLRNSAVWWTALSRSHELTPTRESSLVHRNGIRTLCPSIDQNIDRQSVSSPCPRREGPRRQVEIISSGHYNINKVHWIENNYAGKLISNNNKGHWWRLPGNGMALNLNNEVSSTSA